MPNENAIIVINPQRALAEASARRQIVEQMRTTSILRQGIDYGVVPGTSKPSLLKPGAERLCAAMGFNPHFDLIGKIEQWTPEQPLFHYQYRCNLIHIETGLEVATGIGSCNSMEAKYRWRKAERVCPVCGVAAIIKGKDEYGGGWVCFNKKGGCGSKFRDGDPQIEAQVVGNIPNDDIYSLVNTIDKMAQKRALVAATLIGANASEFFTQDVEDLPGFGGDVVEGRYEEVAAGQPQSNNNGGATSKVTGAGVGSKTTPPAAATQTFGSVAAWNDFNLRMKAAFPRYATAKFKDVFGVEKVSDIRGTVADAEKKVREWLANELGNELGAEGHPEEAEAVLNSQQEQADSSTLYFVDRVLVQKEKGVNNFSYVLMAINGSRIHVYTGDAFRAAGLDPGKWKKDGHAERFDPALEVTASQLNGKWTVHQIVVPEPIPL